MTTRDLKSNITVAVSLEPKARTNGTGTGSTVDLRGYDSACVAFEFGTWTDGTHTPKVLHSADNTTFTDAGTDGALDGALTAITSSTGANAAQQVGYTGNNRYLLTQMIVTGSTTGALSASQVIRGNPNLAPVA